MAGFLTKIKRGIAEFNAAREEDEKFLFKSGVKYLLEDCDQWLKRIRTNRQTIEERSAERERMYTPESLVQANAIADQMWREVEQAKEKIGTFTARAEVGALEKTLHKTIRPEKIIQALKYQTPDQRRQPDVPPLRDRRLIKETD